VAVGALAGLAMGGVLLAASVLTLGLPNVGLAGQFLSGAYPSMPSALAFLSLLCYAVVLGAVTVAVVRGLRMATGVRSAGRTARAIAFVLAGVILLSLSVVNRVDTGGGICCGGGAQQIQEAAALAR
jgi:hypothetical protein